MKLWFAGAAALLGAAGAGAYAQDTLPLPSATINYTAKAPKLDGRLDDPCWHSATPLPLQWTWDGRPAVEPAVARLAFDARYVYVSFDVPDPAMVSAREPRDGDLYAKDDVVELLLWPREDQPYYYRCAANPRGTVLDAFYITNAAQDKPVVALPGWNPEIIGQVKAAVGPIRRPGQEGQPTENGRWIVEMGLPLKAFTTRGLQPPANGENWRVQLNRYDRPDAAPDKPAVTCWSPYYVFGWPHVLGRFGRVTLAGAPTGATVGPTSSLPEVALLANPPTGVTDFASTPPVMMPVPTPPVVEPDKPAPVTPPVTPAEPAPVTPPVTPAEPTPVTPAEPAPVTPAEPAPVTPAQPAPVTPAEPTPAEPTPAEPTPVEPTPVEPAPPTPPAETTLSLSINDAPLPDALRVLFRGTEFTYTLDPTLAAAPPKVTLNVENVSWTEALTKLVEAAKVEYAKTGSTYTFTSKAAAPSGGGEAPVGPVPG